MSSTTCPGCGAVVSTTAATCAKCGTALAASRQPRKRPVLLWWIIGLLAVILLAPHAWNAMRGVQEVQESDGTVDPTPVESTRTSG